MTPSLLLVNPRYGGRDGLIILPLDQASVAAYAIAQGCDVEVLDLAFDTTDDRLAARLAEQSFDLVVLTAITVCFRTAIEAAGLIRAARPSQTIALMGEHASFRSAEILERHRDIDLIIRFEAELTVMELVNALHKAGHAGRALSDDDLAPIQGLSYRQNGGCRDNRIRVQVEDLDIFPVPAKELFNLPHYLERDDETTMITTRGCTHRCQFCHRWRYGRRLRNFSLPRVMEEIERNVSYGFRSIFFQDDVFCYDKQRTRRFCEMLIERGLDINWNCNVRVDDFDPANDEHGELASLMQRSGCYRIFVGIEAFDQELLDRSKKLAQVSQIGDFVRFWQKRGVQVHASYIVGLPGDSVERIERRVELAIDLKTDLASFNRIFPHPGTPYGDKPDAHGISVPDPYWYEKTDWWSASIAGTHDLPPDKIYELQQWALTRYTRSWLLDGAGAA